ncbi:MAG TPA: isoleucine--tRNA ligase [Myxococcota bacterium]|nr:isoleucine--tRNA ligase [Myxococcota bacterium]
MSARPKDRVYPEVEAQPSFPTIEERVLAYWRANRIFERSVENRPAGERGANEYVFYDGPPFANGLPHYGHLLTGFVKDIVPRYQTLRGRRVTRNFGWDCHGLPAEMEAEKELGISGRAKITEYGIDRFNDYCRSSVLRYTEAWQETVTRQARWVDFRNDYKTMDLSYMESVMWAFKQLYERGLVYEGYRVMPYSWAAQTPVSNFETRLDNSYRERQDPAITVRFALAPSKHDQQSLELWVWTTTPWTLPSNLALAVGEDIEYAVFEKDGRRFALGAATVEKYAAELEGVRRVGSLRGSELVGRTYAPLYPFFAGTPNAFRVLSGTFVDTAEGTGVVHMAPGFGEDDMAACVAAGIPVLVPVDESGKFTAEVTPWQGQLVFDANRPIMRELRERGLLVRQDTIVHNYPHCWRTDTPLIYRAMSSWFVKVSDFRDRMVELNREIRWIPSHIRDGLFGKWLEGARDWSISRNRFWGSPIPVWRSDNPDFPRIDVYGSLDELERDFGVRPDDLHRPAIDQLVRPNPDDPSGKSLMRRVTDVLDCWFESGSMFYAQVHYPFEKREWFDTHFPADFITEYVAQTRGWFYTMHVLATALFDRPAFANVICHGVVLDENGQKLSKRMRNYPSPEEVFSSYGADALRWFLCSSPILRGADLQIDREGHVIREIVRLVLRPIWNAYYFFCLYANADGVRAVLRSDASGVLDRYVLAKTGDLVRGLEKSLDAYDIPGACAEVASFIDALNNWYIRRSRDRFWAEDGSADKRDAYDTLYSALVVALRAASPLLPLISEEIYRGLTGEESVHLCDWPDSAALPSEPELVRAMDRAREVCSAALALRRAHDVRVRQPLRELVIAGADVDGLRPFAELIADEVNVKTVALSAEIERFATFKLAVNARTLGKRLGKKTQEVIAAAKAGRWKQVSPTSVEVAGESLSGDDYQLLLEPRPGVVCQPLASNDAIVILDTTLDETLASEGIARDVVRAVQQARREAGLHVSDRIQLALELPADWRTAAERFQSYIAEQTLATELVLGAPGPGFTTHSAEVSGELLRVALRRAG